MKIKEAAIDLSSKRSFIQRDSTQEFFSIWQGRRRLADSADELQIKGSTDTTDQDRNAADRVPVQQRPVLKRRILHRRNLEIPTKMKTLIELKIRLLRALFERITGRKFQVLDPAKFLFDPAALPRSGIDAARPAFAGGAEDVQRGLIYNYTESHYESEKVDFSAAGFIHAADGDEISFSLTLSMDREFYAAHTIEMDIGQVLKDPLVLNFAGETGELTERNFHFDIDGDGALDQISFVKPGSGFLALDKNGDGTIGDGTELFGALSGDGFEELSQYDSDDNRWIDENDAIFQRLRIWSKNSEGEDQLVALGKAGVGAIYLEHIETQFSLEDDENGLLGQVRDTGLAVMETGKFVTVQQLDLVA